MPARSTPAGWLDTLWTILQQGLNFRVCPHNAKAIDRWLTDANADADNSRRPCSTVLLEPRSTVRDWGTGESNSQGRLSGMDTVVPNAQSQHCACLCATHFQPDQSKFVHCTTSKR